MIKHFENNIIYDIFGIDNDNTSDDEFIKRFIGPSKKKKRKKNINYKKKEPILVDYTYELYFHIALSSIKAYNSYIYQRNRRNRFYISQNRSNIQNILKQKNRNNKNNYYYYNSNNKSNFYKKYVHSRESFLNIKDNNNNRTNKLITTILYFNKPPYIIIQTRCTNYLNYKSIPKYNAWTLVKKNYYIQDQPILKHKPYFGDDDSEDVVSEVYEIKKRQRTEAEKEVDLEISKYIVSYIDKKYNNNIISKALLIIAETCKLPLEILKKAAESIEKNKFSSESFSLAKEITSTIKQPFYSNLYDTKLASCSDVKEKYSIICDSYKILFCRQCYTYDCNFHSFPSSPYLDIVEKKALNKNQLCNLKIDEKGTHTFCGEMCYKSKKIDQETTSSLTLSQKTKTLLHRLFVIFDKNFCSISSILSEGTCKDMAYYYYNHYINDNSQIVHNDIDIRPKLNITKTSKSNKKRNLSNKNGNVKSVYYPCAHYGPCIKGICSCADDNRSCLKYCYCINDNCDRSVLGCHCTKGKCRTSSCPCFLSESECDPDFCSLCTHSDQDDHNKSCQNMSIQQNKHRKINIGVSTIKEAGWGIYAAEHIKKDEFIQEYTGELISSNEAERRGRMYDKTNKSFLFQLDSEQTVDATRKGNKTKFINHSNNPNCIPKIIHVNGNYRIGIYALKNIEPSEELFYNYGYDVQLKYGNKVIKKGKTVDWMIHSNMAGMISNQNSK